MADAKYRDLILDTIDQLRKRKARPDLERISHMLDRRHGVSASEVETDLEKLVDGEIVIKVDYKGSTSYRNAAKWRRSHLGGHVLNSSDTSLFIGNIIATLCGDSGDREQGVSIHDVEKYVGTEKPDSDLCTKGRLLVALQREVDVGALKRLPNGNYARGNPADVKKASKLHGKGLGHGKAGGPGQGKSSGGPGKAGSTPGRKAGQTAKRKRLKTDASPERHHESSDSRPLLESGGHNTAASTADADDRCDYCLLTADGNPSDEAEGLLVCKDCHAKAHPSCMNYSADLALRSRMSPWQCFDCKTCNVCYDSGEGDSMLFCDACDKGYHMKCHTPNVAKKPTGKWVCFKCEHDGVRDPADNGTSEAETASQDSSLGGVDGLDGASCLPTPCDSPVNGEPMNMYATAIKTDEMLNKVGECHPGSDEIPDASDWAIEEVVNYFIDVGFLDQAAAFREQEIDGKSLLLMKRSDVLTGLNLKLGPALKIYSHVCRLQIRENSPSDFLL